jgi:tartrate-resistant acid phosphatase type 5
VNSVPLALSVLILAAACENKSSPRNARPPSRNAAAPTIRGSGGSDAWAGGETSSGGNSISEVPSAQAGTAGTASATDRPPPNPVECDATPLAGSVAATRFAVIGDYGTGGPEEAAVAALVKSWRPDFILTTGDNNYPTGGADTIDAHIGQFFHDFICPYRGTYGPGGTRNRFFPALGNHDWYTTGAVPYLDYFTLPGNERYYDMAWGNVHAFAVDSDPSEPDGVSSTSTQAQWLKTRMASSSARWKVVTMHHPPFSSGPHASTPYMQWPYKEWGASLVLAGHDHIYEKLEEGGLPYVVIGLGGASLYQFMVLADGSVIRYNAGYGAALIEADATRLVMRFFTSDGTKVDELVLTDK